MSEASPRARGSILFPMQIFALAIAAAAALALAMLVMTTDPDLQEQRLFTILVFFGAAGVGTIVASWLGAHTDSPVLDAVRALRRGVLAGIAVAGVVFLQFNSALRPTNLAFVLLVVLIAEMIFLARRQHPS